MPGGISAIASETVPKYPRVLGQDGGKLVVATGPGSRRLMTDQEWDDFRDPQGKAKRALDRATSAMREALAAATFEDGKGALESLAEELEARAEEATPETVTTRPRNTKRHA